MKKNRHKNFVAVVPARLNSKRLINKNILNLVNKPLYKWTIDQISILSLKCYISRDINEILNTKFKKNIHVVKRPKNLCLDNSKMEDVILHLIKKYKLYDTNIVLLQPTSPLRGHINIKLAMDLFYKKKSSFLMSVSEVSSDILKCGTIEGYTFNPVREKEFVFSNQQNLPKVYKPNGAIYIFNGRNFIIYKGFNFEKITPFIMNHKNSIDIDNIADFKRAEKLIIKGKVKNL